MKHCKTILLIIFILCSKQLFAQVLTLDTILSRIEQNNPMLKMYDEQITGVQNYSQMTKSWMPPKISVGKWQTPYESLNEGMWMISAEQMIPNPSKQQANYDYMQGMTDIESQKKFAKRNEMFAIAKQVYYSWIVLKKKHEVLVQTDSLLDYIIQVAQIRYTFNKEKLTTIYKAQADLFVIRNMETMVLGDMKMKNIELNTLMNAVSSAEFDIDTTIQIHNYEAQANDTMLISTVRSDIKQYDAGINTAKLQQEFERTKRFPEFGVSVTHMQSTSSMPSQFSVMGMMSLPFVPWASKDYQANIQGLDNTINAINYQKQSEINEIAGEIASLQTQIRSVKQQLNAYKEKITPAFFNSYQSSLIGYQQNTEDLFTVLDGLKMYRMAKTDELDQLQALLSLEVRYEKEMEIR